VDEIANAGQRFANGDGLRDRGVDLRRDNVNDDGRGAEKGDKAMLMIRNMSENTRKRQHVSLVPPVRNGQLEFSSVAMPRLSGSRLDYRVVNGITR
jgi:hypothetical protein